MTDLHQASIIRRQIDKLLAAHPETGAQWAEICRLEAEAIVLEAKS